MATDTEGSIPKSDTWDLYASEVNTGVVGVPVGTILSWAKDLTGGRTIPNTFVECNGQTLSDSDSVYNGVVIPNLNGTTEATKLFLRGSTTSGGTGGSATAGASHSHGTSGGSGRYWRGRNSGSGSSSCISHGSISASNKNITLNTIPKYVEMVWIMRIK